MCGLLCCWDCAVVVMQLLKNSAQPKALCIIDSSLQAVLQAGFILHTIRLVSMDWYESAL